MYNLSFLIITLKEIPGAATADESWPMGWWLGRGGVGHGRRGFDVHGLWDVWVWHDSEFCSWVVVVWWWWMHVWVLAVMLVVVWVGM